MEFDYKAIIPYIPQMIAAGKSVWELMIKPWLESKKYPVSLELEQEMLAKEKSQDIAGIIEKLEEFSKAINNTMINQTNYGDNSQQMAFNNFGKVEINIDKDTSNKTNANTRLELSDNAFLLLEEISKDEWCELRITDQCGGLYSIHTNCKEFGSIEPIKATIMKDAVIELKNNDYIRPKRKNTFEITTKGIKYLESKKH